MTQDTNTMNVDTDSSENSWEKAIDLCKKSVAYALYKKFDSDSIELIIQLNDRPKTIYEFSPINSWQGYVIAPFNIDYKNPIILIRADKRITIPLKKRTVKQHTKKSFGSYSAAYKETFNKFVTQLNDSNIKKLVLSRKESHHVSKTEPFRYFKNACLSYPKSFVSLWSTKETGTWISASPEIIVEKSNNVYRTMALAGTKSNDNILTDNDLIVWDKKNIEEQRIVEDFITQKLHDLNLEFHKTSPYTIRAGNLFHIRTDFSFQNSKETSIEKIISCLHPTPAVCGWPQDEAKKFILSNEKHDREYYAGFNGPINMNNATSLFVTLRCIKIGKDTITYYAGGGIIKDSLLENEWTETAKKMDTMKHIINYK